MTNPFTAVVDRFFGRGKYAVTIPAMDGPLLPNSLLDTAKVVAQSTGPDNLCMVDAEAYFSSGVRVLRLGGLQVANQLVCEFSSDVTALAARDDGQMVACLRNGNVAVWNKDSQPRIFDEPTKLGLTCLTAIAIGVGEDVFLTNGSEENGSHAWAKDLMERNSSGSVWRFNSTTGACTEVAKGLAFPSGILVRDSQLIISEAWKHRLIALNVDGSGKRTILLADLPAYPSRIIGDTTGEGYWLCLFAPRSQLIEFVLRENAYRTRMMAEAPPEFWIAPTLRSGTSFLEPLQGGGVKRMGILKPWAPTRSYGLVVTLDANFQVTNSFHSRADGVRHGVTSVVAMRRGVMVTAKGGDVILELATNPTMESSHAAHH
ncbi:strictosidine synthase [Paraburkholderia sp. 22B1P]|uniref:strictosidine synthase n=1 Tax=Paraburkholderia sp. 22B1P TaxID=3080498 RepID=UPI0030916EDE|nr:SMP-30/gluconolactonase/LRE family protein [Paraburkholderia sp. 22B1P]